MEHQVTIHKRLVRSACELRLGRRLLDHEFERMLRLGNGVYWNYQRGMIAPYDPATLQSRQRELFQSRISRVTPLPRYAASDHSLPSASIDSPE